MLNRAFALILASLVVVTVGAADSSTGFAKEYNKRQHLAPEQRAKVDRVIAKSRNSSQLTAQSGQQGTGGDVTNVGCGKLQIGGSPSESRRNRDHRNRASRDEIVVVTGDVINVARGCRGRR
jgi:hypothetical protein